MPFIDNIKFNEILNASRNGNEKAMAIMQSMKKAERKTTLTALWAHITTFRILPNKLSMKNPNRAQKPLWTT